jgi:hypothetical protein
MTTARQRLISLQERLTTVFHAVYAALGCAEKILTTERVLSTDDSGCCNVFGGCQIYFRSRSVPMPFCRTTFMWCSMSRWIKPLSGQMSKWHNAGCGSTKGIFWLIAIWQENHSEQPSGKWFRNSLKPGAIICLISAGLCAV